MFIDSGIENLANMFAEFRETSRDVVCFSSDLTVNIGSIRPECRVTKSMHIAVAL